MAGESSKIPEGEFWVDQKYEKHVLFFPPSERKKKNIKSVPRAGTKLYLSRLEKKIKKRPLQLFSLA